MVWEPLNHPNIVPFKGVTSEPLQLVSEWMPGGELRQYIRNNPHANVISLVSSLFMPLSIASSCYQLLGIAEGLDYLHSRDVIHGDIKGVRELHTCFAASVLMVIGLVEYIG